MKTDFLVTMGTYHTNNEDYFRVHGLSMIAGAILTYYYGEIKREHDEMDIVTMNPKEFKDFKDYCKRASANKFDFVFTLTV